MKTRSTPDSLPSITVKWPIPECGYLVRYKNAINYNKLYAGGCRFVGCDLNPGPNPNQEQATHPHLQIKASTSMLAKPFTKPFPFKGDLL